MLELDWFELVWFPLHLIILDCYSFCIWCNSSIRLFRVFISFFALLLFVLVSIAFSVLRSSVLLVDLWHSVVFIHDLISISDLPGSFDASCWSNSLTCVDLAALIQPLVFSMIVLFTLIALFYIAMFFFSVVLCLCLFLKACLCLISLCWCLHCFVVLWMWFDSGVNDTAFRLDITIMITVNSYSISQFSNPLF
jgi:hypothetical protein